MESETYLTPAQAQEILGGIKRARLNALRRAGRLPGVLIAGTVYVYRPKDVEQCKRTIDVSRRIKK